MKNILSAFVVWKMEGACGKDLSLASNAKSAPGPTISKETGTSVLQPQELNSANSVHKLGSEFFPAPPGMSPTKMVS